MLSPSVYDYGDVELTAVWQVLAAIFPELATKSQKSVYHTLDIQETHTWKLAKIISLSMLLSPLSEAMAMTG